MLVMTVAVAMAAGGILLSILLTIFKGKMRYFLKIKDFLMDKKFYCISGKSVRYFGIQYN